MTVRYLTPKHTLAAVERLTDAPTVALTDAKTGTDATVLAQPEASPVQ